MILSDTITTQKLWISKLAKVLAYHFSWIEKLIVNTKRLPSVSHSKATEFKILGMADMFLQSLTSS
jgi:hypothetical protein